MTAKSVLLRPEGLRPRARAPTFPPCYTTGCYADFVPNKNVCWTLANIIIS